jgi:type VI secretion system protein ImpH
MASETGPAAHLVAALTQLQQEPHLFDFFEAMRRIECAWPMLPRLGTAKRPADEPVRLGQVPHLEFPGAMLAPGDIHRGRPGPMRVSGYFFGLYGPNGPLPLHLTEYAHDRLVNSADRTLVDFTDVFHHRMLSLFYRGWAHGRPTVCYDRPEEDRFAGYVGALIGLGSRALRDRDAWPDRAKWYFSGLLAAGNKTRGALEGMLAEYLQLPVRVQECVGEWLAVSPQELMRLGDPNTGVLGRSVLGERVWSVQNKIRIVLGPVEVGDLLQYLPGSPSLERLRAAVLNYLGFEYAWDLQLVMHRSRLPPLRLGQFGHLGWSSWVAGLGGERGDAEVHDVIIEMSRPVGT